MLADRWTAAAAWRCALLRADDRAATASWARRTLARAAVTVRQRVDSRRETAREDLVAAAADALEACAATWQALGPVAGPRRLHLVRRLESQLAEHERLVLAAEVDYRLDRRAVEPPASAARLAIERLRDGSADPAAALVALEENVLALATIAIRAVENIDATGCANGRAGRALAPAPAGLHARFSELDAHAHALLEPGYGHDLATSLSECLIIASRSSARGGGVHALAQAPTDRSEPDPRRRRGWLRLGARELLVTRELAPPSADQADPHRGEVVSAAGRILANTGLATRANALDSKLAWANQASALSGLIPVCARAVQGDVGAGQRARRILIDRLARVVLVLWLLDHQSPRPQLGTAD